VGTAADDSRCSRLKPARGRPLSSDRGSSAWTVRLDGCSLADVQGLRVSSQDVVFPEPGRLTHGCGRPVILEMQLQTPRIASCAPLQGKLYG
jgi:hypothetical protein